MENYIKPDKVYVLDKHQTLLAVFDKDDEEPIINPQIEKTQNAESVFTFTISANNSKWVQINNPENLYVVDGKVYSTNFEGCFEEVISESDEDLIRVTAYERQKLLSRKYVRAWNSETGFEKIDTFMVVILSNGNLALKNNGSIVPTTHAKGTSGYVLDALLYGTGWSTGTCDVEGTFDFETDQVDIYENILKVQEIWGGILVFDSINRTVSHRDETTWLPYNGYEVKYQKNMQSLEKLYNNKIITKLCPLGEGGLNIKSVNNNSEWLTNYTYTNTTLEGIENNPDITDPEQLKRWGQRKLQDLCKPRTELTVKAALLYQVEGYELERVDLNDIVDVINLAGSGSEAVQLRVVGFTYKLWDYSDAELELSDITLESTDIFKKNVQATNQINAGTLNTTQVISFFRAGETVEKSLRNVNDAVAEITINQNSIALTVKNGGLNLLENTTDKEWKEISVTATEGRSASMTSKKDISDLGLSVGEQITYSLYIKSTSGKKLRARISYYDENSVSLTPSSYAENEYVVQNAIGYSYVTGIIPAGCKYIDLWVDADLTSSTITTTTTEYIKSEKLEKGSIPTAWTPAMGDYSTSAEIKVTTDAITSRVEKLEDFTRNITETNDIHLTDTIEGDGYITNFIIYGNTQNFVYLVPSDTLTPSDTLVPLGDHFTLVVDTRSRIQGKSGSAIELDVKLAEPIRNIGDVCDELRVTDYIVSVYRRIGVDANNELYILTTPTTEVIGTLRLPTFENNTYLYVDEYENLKYTANYITSNEYSKYFTTKVQLSTAITETEKQILLMAQQKMDTSTAEALFSIMAENISSKVSKDNLSSEISQSAGLISLEGNRISIKSDFYELTEDGRIIATSGNIAGFELNATNFSKDISGLYEYNKFDCITIIASLLGRLNFNNNMQNILDSNEDGEVNIVDVLNIVKIINKEKENTKYVSGRYEINSNNPKKCVIIRDSNGEEVLSFGLGGINSTFISVNQCVVGDLSANYNDSPYVAINGNTGDIYATGTITQSSLKDRKKNFEKLENALDIIKNIDIYKYNLKTENDNDKKHIGFVIGNNFNYSKEITSKNDDGADTYSFVSVCCKAIQEQQEEIEKLKEEILKLKKGENNG